MMNDEGWIDVEDVDEWLLHVGCGKELPYDECDALDDIGLDGLWSAAGIWES